MSENQEKLNEQLFNVLADEKASDEARLKKLKYLVRLGADVNARLYGKSVLSKAFEKGVGAEVVEFLEKYQKKVSSQKTKGDKTSVSQIVKANGGR